MIHIADAVDRYGDVRSVWCMGSFHFHEVRKLWEDMEGCNDLSELRPHEIAELCPTCLKYRLSNIPENIGSIMEMVERLWTLYHAHYTPTLPKPEHYLELDDG